MNQDQQRAVAGGLQAHSVGGTYPFCVVGIGNGSDHHYEVHNLQRDTVLYCAGKKLTTIRAHVAEDIAAAARSLSGPAWTWEPRQPYDLKAEQARRATDGNTVEPPAALYKPVHGGYPDVIPCDTTGLFYEDWPAPGVSRYA